MNNTLVLATQLITIPSVTPDDISCQEILADRLRKIGFQCETISSGMVTNLWARKGQARPLVVFAGHTDVVPPGPLDQWQSPPFSPEIRGEKLYGRGTTDMKTAIAAFVVAAEEFIEQHPKHQGSIGLLITSDEEGPATDGTVVVCDRLKERGEQPDYCIVGEPTSVVQLGDMIKNGRRGSLHGRLTIKGIQGHIAYPHLARNPIHLGMSALASLAAEVWDDGDEYYQPTSWQISNIHGGNGTKNVIPGEMVVDFNFRFAPVSTVEKLRERVCDILDKHELEYKIDWHVGALPFFAQPGKLSTALTEAIRHYTNAVPEISTTGGTSDGRFIAQICEQVVEFGPPNASAHKIDEHIEVRFIEPLKNIYRRTLENLLLPA